MHVKIVAQGWIIYGKASNTSSTKKIKKSIFIITVAVHDHRIKKNL